MRRIAFDMSSIMWTLLQGGRDPQAATVEFEGKKVQVNKAPYGFEKVMNVMGADLEQFKVVPKHCILVVEGVSSKVPRLQIDPGYKASRQGRAPESYAQFELLKDQLITLWRSFGATVVIQDCAEGDDTLGWLAHHIKSELVVRTYDNDLAVLIGKNQHGANIIVKVGDEVNLNKFGIFESKYITVYKALVGDSSDNIKGIKGFGQKAFESFFLRFRNEGLAYLQALAESNSVENLEEDASKDKMLSVIFNGGQDFLRSYKLAKLHPEWVNTNRQPLQWLPGLINGKAPRDLKLATWNTRRHLITADRWEAFKPWFFKQLESLTEISLDIETSTPNESDDWLLAQGKEDGVDTIGSELTGMSLTFGTNFQETVYIPVDHIETANVPKLEVGKFLYDIQVKRPEIVIHNTQFEGTVLFNEFGELFMPLGNEGLLCNWRDTKLEASYVNENGSLGLKKLAKHYFNYDQVEYSDVTQKKSREQLPHGRLVGVASVEVEPAVFTYKTDDQGTERPQLVSPAIYAEEYTYAYKMRELPATHVFDYACDDTVVTASLTNFARLFMELEGTWEVYRKVELSASYAHTQSFIQGTPISLAKLAELQAIDQVESDKAWLVVREYLISQGWEGTKTPVFESELTPADIKVIHQIVLGSELKTMIRTVSKLLNLIDSPLLVAAITETLSGNFSTLNTLVAMHFKGEPQFNTGSTTQMCGLLYETMGLPIRVRNPATDAARARGEREGTPKADDLALRYAMQDAPPELQPVLHALHTIKRVQTLNGLYYKPYPYFVHWKTGKVHSSHNQCATNTRRASTSAPNLQQLPKHPKHETDEPPRLREVFIPHKRNAVIVSMDFSGQELRIIAERSQDANMLACYVGDNLKDMHLLTGLGILQSEDPTWDYPKAEKVLADKSSPEFKSVKEARTLGKKTNFTTEYGARAKKLAETLMVSKEAAQIFINAREAAFPRAAAWKLEVIEFAKQNGFVRTMAGAVRHLTELFLSPNKMISSKAERQAVNTEIQGSAAEMTKLAEGRIWDARLEQKFDCKIIAPIHDEIVASCIVENLYEFLPAMHACMVADYAGMRVPIVSSISFGPNFGVQFEIGNFPTREAIAKGLADYAEWKLNNPG